MLFPKTNYKTVKVFRRGRELTFYECNYCRRSFTTKYNLNRHLKQKHKVIEED